MISVAKLKRLPRKTRLRKIALILRQAEHDLSRGRNLVVDWLAGVIELIYQETELPPETRRYLLELSAARSPNPQTWRRVLNGCRHTLLRRLKMEAAEWDLLFSLPEEEIKERVVLPMGVYLEELRSPYNVGSVFRTAEAFGVRRIMLSPSTPSPEHPRAIRSARGTVHLIPWGYADLDYLEDQSGVFALELGGTPIQEFCFPREGLVLIGSEELGLSPDALKLADRQAGRVSIPMAGFKRSLNVAVAFGILMHHWFLHFCRSGG